MISFHFLRGFGGIPHSTLSLRFIGVIMWLFRSDKYIMNGKALRPESECGGRARIRMIRAERPWDERRSYDDDGRKRK